MMDSVELRLERLLERLARENRQLLALLRMGLPLRRAEQVLEGEVGATTPTGHPGTSFPRGRAAP